MFVICSCVCVLVYAGVLSVCLCVHLWSVSVHTCGRQRLTLEVFLCYSLPYLFLYSDFSDSARLTGQQTPGNCLSLPSQG